MKGQKLSSYRELLDKALIDFGILKMAEIARGIKALEKPTSRDVEKLLANHNMSAVDLALLNIVLIDFYEFITGEKIS